MLSHPPAFAPCAIHSATERHDRFSGRGGIPPGLSDRPQGGISAKGTFSVPEEMQKGPPCPGACCAPPGWLRA